MLEHAQVAASLGVRPTLALAVAALAALYAGDVDQARSMYARAAVSAESPTQRGFAAYVAGEIENAMGRPDRAEQPYREAIDLGRRAGASFLVGIASVGLVSALAAAGRVDDALRGYREVIDYFARNGN